MSASKARCRSAGCDFMSAIRRAAIPTQNLPSFPFCLGHGRGLIAAGRFNLLTYEKQRSPRGLLTQSHVGLRVLWLPFRIFLSERVKVETPQTFFLHRAH